jgi:hypothetical protein
MRSAGNGGMPQTNGGDWRREGSFVGLIFEHRSKGRALFIQNEWPNPELQKSTDINQQTADSTHQTLDIKIVG